MKVRIFNKDGMVEAIVEVGTGAEAVMLLGILYVLKDGCFRETDVAEIISWGPPKPPVGASRPLTL